LLVEVITFNLGFATMFSLTWLVSSRMLTTIPQPTSPLFWAMLSLIAVACLVVLFPLHYWLIGRGYSVPSDRKFDPVKNLNFPTLRSTWPTFLVTLGIMIAAMAFAISQVA
jgi:drug/metabolite transporter (DMT)-like permease